MKNYALTYPRLFTAVSKADTIVSPLAKPVLMALAATESVDFLLEVFHLSPCRMGALTILTAAYLTTFHMFAEEKGRTFLSMHARTVEQKLLALLS